MQTVKIQTIDGLTHVFVGDCELKKIRNIKFDQSVDTAPCFAFKTMGLPNIVIDNADIRFEFTPETVSDSTKVLRHSLHTDGVLYGAFVASIASALKEVPAGMGLYDVAQAVADRVIGIE